MLVESPLGENPDGQRGLGRLEILQEGSLKGTGAGCPHVLQDERAGKRTGLAEKAAFPRTQEKREGLRLLEERVGNSRGLQGSH